MDTKQCGTCGEAKDVSAFSKDARSKCGLQSRCKACFAQYRQEHRAEIAQYKVQWLKDHRSEMAAYKARWYQDHREEVSQQHAQWYIDHAEERRQYMVQYYQEHRDEQNAYGAQYRQEHREEKAQYGAQWKKNNPDKVRAYCHRRRAIKMAVDGKYTAADIQRQGDSQGWKCWWRAPGCLINCKDNYHVDHLVPLSRGGHNNPSNLVISCPTCNLKKHAKTPDEFAGRLF